MKRHVSRKGSLVGLAALVLGLTTSVHAQQRQGGGGGGFGGAGFGGQFGGFGGAGGGNNSRTASGAYNFNGSVGSALISVDPQTHNIVVITDAQTSLQISNVIANLDSPKPQVLINVVFMEVTHTDGFEFGIEGTYVKGGNTPSTAGTVFGLAGLNTVVTNFNGQGQAAGTALATNSTGGGAGGLYQIAGSNFQATLRALATAGKAKVLSRPSVVARDGQLARIVVGQSVPLPNGVSFYTSGGNTIPIINVNYTDVGIIMNVTPYIDANGKVEMIVQPQISSVSQTQSQSLSAQVNAPYINVRSADTVVVTPDAETVVIGGLIAEDQTKSVRKVPWLGDIPWIGNLFKTTSKTGAKTELLIFLTPRIIRTPADFAAITGQQTERAKAITNAVTEKEWNQFLDKFPSENLPAKTQ
jgi:general secretion pathway protein D